MVKDVNDEQYVIIILAEQAESNTKDGPLFVDQSQNAPERNKTTEIEPNKQPNQKRTFENNRREQKLRSSEIHTD